MSGRRRKRTLAQIEEDYQTPDEETEVQHRRRKANKRKALSRFNAELRRQANAEWTESERFVADGLDETKKSNARAAQKGVVLSDEDRLYIQQLDRKRKTRHRASLTDEVRLYLVYKSPGSLLPASFARHQQPSDAKAVMQSVQEIYISVRDSTNCTDVLEAVRDLSPETCVTASDIKVEEDLDMAEEEDPLAISSPAVKAEQENRAAVLEPVSGLCSETSLTACDIKVKEDLDMAEEEDPLAVTSPALKSEQENCTDVLEAVHDLSTETCVTASDIKVEEGLDMAEEEDPLAVTSPAVKAEQESLQTSELSVKSCRLNYSLFCGTK